MLSQYPQNCVEFSAGHLLHRLYVLQQTYLHISTESMAQVAEEFELPVSQVASVVDFYAFFYQKPVGRYHMLLSNCTSCGYQTDQHNLLEMICRLLNVKPEITRPDGRVSVGETSCIGMCDHGAAMLINGVPLVGLNAEKLAHITHLISENQPLSCWPMEWFRVENNIHKQDVLLNEHIQPGSSLKKALAGDSQRLLDIILHSGLRGRGGAGFDTGRKWQLCREAEGKAHYVVCNADEGEPGTFKDRVLLQSYADALFEGMALCAYVIGARKGFVYLRGEYRYLLNHLQNILKRRYEQSLLGPSILGKAEFSFDIEIVVGAGAYICGEESALIESMEGRPGIPRIRPPFPVTHGYLGQPTAVNNVETLIAAAYVAYHGSDWFKAMGTEQSTGSKILSVSGDCRTPGIYEYTYGISVQQVLSDCGAKNAQAVQIGGPAGALVAKKDFSRQISFEDLSTGGSFLIFGAHRDLLSVNQNFARFFAHESCGFCTPCRVGTRLLESSFQKIADGRATRQDIQEIKQLSALVRRYSHCGLGHTAANHILDGLKDFSDIFEEKLVQTPFTPSINLDAALEDARQITRRDDADAHLE
ncbi:NAD(P)-dependent nickel-iron dehydrogenase flavin-containing subunit [Nitrosomonas aestuarii]|uniref:NAD(P)-dependent nickel-iron dehydrogenase flavin-containing subunit n=1 Tax=Nitrosomonas aestuarii TaxID=52441 RepID=A0A1I3ZSL2_9PROT|nr:NAD(P)H-dependent oxidoreductase subunit E [Nitrosomonas aestuarii]SFK46993.1 NAD(P)-dependent nickel-iron dehydrogenase flavin-containing subunit [Nitrosomonas aestuarii]